VDSAWRATPELGSSFAGEGNGECVLCVGGGVVDAVVDALSEDCCFARPGTCEHDDGIGRGGDRLVLFSI
jgi:hypothetical protein